MSRVQCLSGCSEVTVEFRPKIVPISRPSIARVPCYFGHLRVKFPGKNISLDIHLHNTGVCSRGEMQFRLAEARAARLLLVTFCASPRRPARARPPRSGLLRGFCASPRRPARARNSPPEPARACSEAFAHRRAALLELGTPRRSPLGSVRRCPWPHSATLLATLDFRCAYVHEWPSRGHRRL